MKCQCWAAFDANVVASDCSLARSDRKAHLERISMRQLDIELEHTLINCTASSAERSRMRQCLAREFA